MPVRRTGTGHISLKNRYTAEFRQRLLDGPETTPAARTSNRHLTSSLLHFLSVPLPTPFLNTLFHSNSGRDLLQDQRLFRSPELQVGHLPETLSTVLVLPLPSTNTIPNQSTSPPGRVPAPNSGRDTMLNKRPHQLPEI